jgi:peptide chain release factor 2
VRSKTNSKKYGGFFDLESKKLELSDIQRKIENDPTFWERPKESALVLKSKKVLEAFLDRAKALKAKRDDMVAAKELAEDGDDFAVEAERLAMELKAELIELEVQSLLGGELDLNDAVVTINAGAGGTESCDWASMLYRMYTRWAERHKFSLELFDLQAGEEAGIKHCTFQISGNFSYGLLKAESGVHRLVRISPFDSNARRHTSFCSIYISPVIDDTIEIEVNPADLRIDTYRASGSGGQHVNKTDSAVRITHLPSGIVVQSQNQRSQLQNRETCMKLLKSRLYEVEMQKREQQLNALENAKSDNSWGSQIRSYVLHPYKLVKDHRTDHEDFSPDEVLDGHLDVFINEFLVKSKKDQIAPNL